MKVVVDLERMLEDGQISQEDFERLRNSSQRDTGSLFFNVLVGFGVIATASGMLTLIPSEATAIVVGILLALSGLLLTTNRAKEWGLLGSMLLLVGAVTAAGGIIAITKGGAQGFFIVTILYAVGAVLAKSVLLTIMSALSLSAVAGAMTAYGHATYFLAIRQPTVTVITFSILAIATYHLSKHLPVAYERIAIAFSRTSLFLVNLGFWIGSLWGDSFRNLRNNWTRGSGDVISDTAFTLVWAIALIVTGIWAAKANKRWVVNLLTVFGAIHFYTQYFERLRFRPGSVLVAGIIALMIAFFVVWYNKSAKNSHAE